jgi:hypothetical protein
MNETTDPTLDRLGATAGVVAVILLVALFMVMPALPAPNHGISEIARSARANRDGLLAGAYLGTMFTAALLVFGACVSARLRRAEGEAGGWWLVSLIGAAAAAVGIVGNALTITFVRAVGHGADGNALWIGYGADHWLGVLVAVPLAVFLLGTGLGARRTGALPRWLAWLALAAAAVLAVGGASVVGDEVDGGVLGSVLLLGYVALTVWIIGTSVTLWRRRGSVPHGRTGSAPHGTKRIRDTQGAGAEYA